jgi:hypothetical protein
VGFWSSAHAPDASSPASGLAQIGFPAREVLWKNGDDEPAKFANPGDVVVRWKRDESVP